VRYETTVPLVSRRLALAAAVGSFPVFLVIAALTWVENDPWWVVVVAGVVLWGPLTLLPRFRLAIAVDDDELRYRVRPWHRRPRVVPLDSIRSIERRFSRPTPRTSLRRVNLGRDWIDWTDEEVRYVVGDEGVRVEREEGQAVELWVDGADDLARALTEARGGPAGRS
jgi:hypothetical protein